MKKQFVVLLGLIFSVSGVALAQTKTVTNADLEKFRQKRLQAEREYRENYKKMGFPSPEELEQKRVRDQEELIEFSQRLEIRRLEREAAQAEAENQALWLQNQYLQSSGNNPVYYSGGYFTGYSPYYYGYFNRYGNRGNFRSGYYSNSYPTGFFNLQFPPPPSPPRIRPPRSLNNFPVNIRNPRVIRSNPRGNVTIRPRR